MASQHLTLNFLPDDVLTDYAPAAGAGESLHCVLRLAGVRRRFGDRVILDNIDLDILDDEFVALIGRSGSGKSTILRILGGLDQGAEGEIQADTAIGYVFQDARLVPWRRVWQNVTLGVAGSAAQRKSKAELALAEVGLADRLDAWPAVLSGGEAQRVALARALLQEPRLLLLDEPFGALDALTRMQMHRLLMDLHARHRFTTLLVTHDVEEAALLSDRVLVLQDGRIAAAHRVDWPRPRRRNDPRLLPVRSTLLNSLGLLEE